MPIPPGTGGLVVRAYSRRLYPEDVGELDQPDVVAVKFLPAAPLPVIATDPPAGLPIVTET